MLSRLVVENTSQLVRLPFPLSDKASIHRLPLAIEVTPNFDSKMISALSNHPRTDGFPARHQFVENVPLPTQVDRAPLEEPAQARKY